MKLEWMCAAALLLTACPSETTPEEDMSTKMDMPAQEDATPDMAPACEVEASGIGPVMACDEASTTACFANDDCAADERCENIGGAADVACCVKGPRGCKTAGQPCQTEFECDEGLCVARNDGPQLCSKRCMSEDECPAEVPECHPVLGLCVEKKEM